MSAWFAAVAFPLSYDLMPFDRYLTQEGIIHRFTEEQTKGLQVLWLVDPEDVEKVKQLVDLMSDDGPEVFDRLDRSSETSMMNPSGNSGSGISGGRSTPMIDWASYWRDIRQFPVTVSFVSLGILGFFLFKLAQSGTGPILNLLTFHKVIIAQKDLVSVYQDLQNGELWRLFTPVFIHFDFMHVAFNCALFWFLGRKIELIQGSSVLLSLSIVSGVLSNLLQASWYGIAFFGGLSGIVYALVGYIWMWQINHPRSNLCIPLPMIIFLLVFLALGFTPIITLFASAEVANGAHLGGVISGIIFGFIHSRLNRSSSRETNDSNN